MTRSVNLDSPAYLEGCSMANRVLDFDSSYTDLWIAVAEAAAERADQNEDTEGYHWARGFLDTFREYTQDQAL
jgi:hypothetical protein